MSSNSGDNLSLIDKILTVLITSGILLLMFAIFDFAVRLIMWWGI